MASITIRNLDDQLKSRLRVRAARRGHSMEEEAREILRTALASDRREPRDLYAAIRQMFDPVGGVEFDPTPREGVREPPEFDR